MRHFVNETIYMREQCQHRNERNLSGFGRQQSNVDASVHFKADTCHGLKFYDFNLSRPYTKPNYELDDYHAHMNAHRHTYCH